MVFIVQSLQFFNKRKKKKSHVHAKQNKKVVLKLILEIKFV